MRHLYYDATHIIAGDSSKLYHGGGYFGFSLLEEIINKKKDCKLTVLWKKNYEPITDIEINAYKCEGVDYLQIETLSEVEFDKNATLFLPLYYFADDELTKELQSIKLRCRELQIIATIHDTRIFLNYRFDEFDKYYKRNAIWHCASQLKGILLAKKAEWRLKHIASFIDSVYTVSNYSMQQIIRYTNVKNIAWFYQRINSLGAIKPIEGLKEKEFLLFVSGNRKEKNFARTLYAYLDVLQKDDTIPPLCVTGNKKATEELIRKVAGNRINLCREKVLCLGFVNEEQMQWLYKECRFLIYTSKYEGFGLPACNALLYGTPVLASNCTSIPEVCGAAAFYVDPYDVTNIERGFEHLLNEVIYKQYSNYSRKYSLILSEMIVYGTSMMARRLIENG